MRSPLQDVSPRIQTHNQAMRSERAKKLGLTRQLEVLCFVAGERRTNKEIFADKEGVKVAKAAQAPGEHKGSV